MESPKLCIHNLLSISLSEGVPRITCNLYSSQENIPLLGKWGQPWINLCYHYHPPPPRYYKVDLRTITLGVPPQEVEAGIENVSFFEWIEIQKYKTLDWNTRQVLTRDSVTVSVDAVVYYRFAALKSRDNVFNIEMVPIPSLRFFTWMSTLSSFRRCRKHKMIGKIRLSILNHCQNEYNPNT